ncbi:MAG TPA: class I SAM-dependent rRNA methyltransferase [Candidatus Binatia bacterium]|nr:class I SAM-dependent rRNA methyltransferase [Candidatus Binatia bacterium]
MLRVILKKGRETPVLRGHPWVFSGAIETVEGDPQAPDTADVYDAGGDWLARGLFSPKSQIRVRIVTWRDVPVDRDFFADRFARALTVRVNYLSPATNAYRLINGEGDFLPGLVVDRYADFLVCQFITSGMELFKATVVDCLAAMTSAKGIFERSEGRARSEEGLEASVGTLSGEAPPELLPIKEHGLQFMVDLRRGQKTGFFLDQRENRQFLSSLAQNATVLNCFSYSGAFSVYALRGGAREVISVDSSRPALELAEHNLELNGFAGAASELIQGDAFAYLKETQSLFDLIVLDPPSLARKRSDLTAAAGGYKYLNLHALRHLKPGGILFTFSCSQHISLDLFQKVVFGAAVDAGRKVSVLKRLGHALDHPVSLHHPEGEYLKGLALNILD